MSRRKSRKFRVHSGKGVAKSSYVERQEKIEVEADQLAKREKYFEIFVMVALLAFGIYHSVIYFGHKVIPISDFPAVVRVGHELLSLKVPSNFKTAPMVGLLQVCLSYLVGGQHPDLTAGWLLNALLHPFNLILLWLVGRQIVGKSALWFAIIAILNPWVMYMLREPILETTLLFFTLLTFYLIFKRSRWCYLLASITMVVRYEGSALILAAFVMDMIYSKSRRERLRALLYSVMASIPLALWLLGTTLAWESGTTHYFNVLFTKEYTKALTGSVESRTGLVLHMKLLWQVGFRPLLMPYPGASQDFGEVVWNLSKVVVTAGFFFGSIYGLCKRQWKILALLIFFVPYFLLHARYPYPLQRFHTNIFWIALLICWFGLRSVWKLIYGDGRVPRQLVLVLQGIVAAIAFIWFFQLVTYLPKISPMSPVSAFLPYVAMVLVGVIFAVRIFIYRRRHFLRELSILALAFLIIGSNQFSLVRLLGDGQRDKEFKLLAGWYVANAKPGEKLAVYMSGVVKIFAPRYAEYIVNFPKAENPSELVKACYEEGITYAVWASREGLSRDHTGYRLLRLDTNIAFLREPKSIEPYQFITQLGSKRGWVNIFRLRRPSDIMEQKPPEG